MAREHSYNTGRIHRADTAHAPARGEEPRRRVAQCDDRSEEPRRPQKKKRKKWPIVLAVCLTLVALFGGVMVWAYMQIDNAIDPGGGGVISATHNTPEEYQGDVFNFLIVGVFREPNSNLERGMGLTDMILYANYVTRDNQLNLLQIPRDSYVGPVSADGKINSLMLTGQNREDPINNLVSVITNQYKLPVDGYFAIDMEALKEVVDSLGGLRVYVPRHMSYRGGELEQGWQWLSGEQAEFFLRTRYGEGFDRADIDRLDNQRHFYSALFRRFMNMTPMDAARLIPIFAAYGASDVDMGKLVSLAMKALQIQSENVMFCKMPGATSHILDEQVGGSELYFLDAYGRGTEEEPGVANLLNQYFRTFGEPVSAGELGIPNVAIPADVALYPPNVQVMKMIQEDEGGEGVDVEPA